MADTNIQRVYIDHIMLLLLFWIWWKYNSLIIVLTNEKKIAECQWVFIK